MKINKHGKQETNWETLKNDYMEQMENVRMKDKDQALDSQIKALEAKLGTKKAQHALKVAKNEYKELLESE